MYICHLKNILIIIFVFIKTKVFCKEDEEMNIAINDNAFEIQRLLYGDITNIKDMFLPPLDEKTDSATEEEITTTEKPCNLEFDYIKQKRNHDVNEFNEITKSLNNITNDPYNITRRYNGWYQGWYDPEEPGHWKEKWSKFPDRYKREYLISLNIQHLIHSRYQIKKAILKKEPIRTDKRYKLGYLFNRLRRIKVEQQKIVAFSYQQKETQYKDLRSLLRLYEKMVRYDVDLTDTIRLIKDIDKEPNRNMPLPEVPKN